MQFSLIGISGLARSGKDSFAQMLMEKNPSFKKGSFALILKETARDYFGWTGNFDGDKNPKDRKMLQELGTEVCRAYFDNLWIELFLYNNKFLNSDDCSIPSFKLNFGDKVMKLLYWHELMQKNLLSYIDFKTKAILLVELGFDGNDDEHGLDYQRRFKELALDYNSEFYNGGKNLNGDDLDVHYFIKRMHNQQTIRSNLNNDSICLVNTDVRFENEFLAIKKVKNSLLIRVDRPFVPKMSHASEKGLDHLNFDLVLQNHSHFLFYLLKEKDKEIKETLIKEEHSLLQYHNVDEALKYITNKYPNIAWSEKVWKEAGQKSYQQYLSLAEHTMKYMSSLTEDELNINRFYKISKSF